MFTGHLSLMRSPFVKHTAADNPALPSPTVSPMPEGKTIAGTHSIRGFESHYPLTSTSVHFNENHQCLIRRLEFAGQISFLLSFCARERVQDLLQGTCSSPAANLLVLMQSRSSKPSLAFSQDTPFLDSLHLWDAVEIGSVSEKPLTKYHEIRPAPSVVWVRVRGDSPYPLAIATQHSSPSKDLLALLACAWTRGDNSARQGEMLSATRPCLATSRGALTTSDGSTRSKLPSGVSTSQRSGKARVGLALVNSNTCERKAPFCQYHETFGLRAF